MAQFAKEEENLKGGLKIEEMIKNGKMNEVMEDCTFCPGCNVINVRD